MSQKAFLLEPVCAVSSFVPYAANTIQSLLSSKGIPNNFYENKDRIKLCKKMLEITANMANLHFILSDV